MEAQPLQNISRKKLRDWDGDLVGTGMKVVLILAATLWLGGSSVFGGTSNAVPITTTSRNISAYGHATNQGVLVGGSVRRALGIGSQGGFVRIRVLSPAGRVISCVTTRVTYLNRRPLARSRAGSFATTVQAASGSTIRVDGGPKC